MSNPEKSRKPLIVGIIAAVVILGVLLALVLTNCTAGQGTKDTQPVQTTVGEEETPTYNLYWNLDRAEYDGKSEAGMSSRKPEADGYFHVRFFLDGEIVELKVADRRTINSIDVNDIMDLKFDEDGIVTGIIQLDDIPCEQVGWKFYVKSAAKTVIKLNSSSSFNGMEVMMDVEETTGVYDMTGMEGEVGKSIVPISGDRVIAIADLSGKLTHVFVFERPTFMKSFEAECQHCMDTVEWKMWDKADTLPLEAGHYQLQNDIQLKTQMSMKEDATICLDLNGYTVDGAENARMISLHNVGCELAIMDTSEAQTGKLRGHGEYGAQGGIVWTRYGAFYLYSGTLDARDMTTRGNGAAVCVPKSTYFYMYGGTIYGGTAKFNYNAETKKYSNGMGGSVYVQGKFVMYDGTITGGKALGEISAWDAKGPKTYQRGYGGNLAIGSPGEFIMEGGTIKNGTSTHNGGNIFADGASITITMNDGTITGGKCTGKGRNGGNISIGSKVVMTINNGYITNGKSNNCAGNLYSNGTVHMNGGYIDGGKCYDWATGKHKAADSTSNIYNVNGRFVMSGGIVTGGFSNIDTAKNTTQTIMGVGGLAQITSNGKYQHPDLTLVVGGDNVLFVVANRMQDSAKIGVNTSMGIFSNPTTADNLDNFYSNVEGVPVVMYDGRLALGRTGCACGLDTNGNHIGDCDGTELFWAPINTNAIPTGTGNYYLMKDIDNVSQCSMQENAQIRLDLNGHTLTAKEGYRAISLHNPGTYFALTDSSAEKTGKIIAFGRSKTQAACIWVRYGNAVIYQGTLDASGFELFQSWDGAGKDEVWGTSDDKVGTRYGAAIEVCGNTSLTMYGGTILGGKTVAETQTKTITEGEGEAATEKEVTFTTAAGCGGAISVASANSVFNMYGGTISGGASETTSGNLHISSSAVVTLAGGVIEGGVAAKNGGNIYMGGGTLYLTGATIRNGVSTGDQGGNLFISGAAELTGGAIEDGIAKNGGNIAINTSKTVLLQGVTVSGGMANPTYNEDGSLKVCTGNGGNIRSSSTNSGVITIAEGTLITGGLAKNGGNISVEANKHNGANPTINWYITGGTIENGEATAFGGNIYLNGGASEGTGTVTMTISGGTITGGKTTVKDGTGGNVRMQSIYTTLNITGGTIENGEAGDYVGKTVTGWAGNIDVYKGTLNMSGGTVSGGKAPNNGGSIRVNGADAVANITGGRITGGMGKDNGGNIWVGTKGTLNVNGTVTDGVYSVEIANGTAKADQHASGGNIHANAGAIVTLNGAYIHDGMGNASKTFYKANVSLTGSGSTVTLGNVNITGAVYLGNHTVTVDGTPIIKAATAGDPSLTFENTILDLTKLGEGEKNIGVTGSGKFAAPATESQLGYFYSDDSEKSIAFDSAALYVGSGPIKYCLCGDVDGHEDTSATTGCNGEVLTWTEWTSTTTLPKETGNYILTAEVVINTTVDMNIPDQIINIDLNGQTVRNKTTGQKLRLVRFAIPNNTTATKGENTRLTIVDIAGNGVIKTDANYDQGSIFWLNASNSTVVLLSGKLDASLLTLRMKDSDPAVPNSPNGANAIGLDGSNNAFIMYGGTFIGGNSANGGDAVFGNSSSSISIYGGTIEAATTSPTGILIRSYNTVTISGGTIGGTVQMDGKDGKGTLTLSGAPEIENIRLYKSSDFNNTPVANATLPVITITGELTNTTPIKVTTMGDAVGAITAATVEANADNFVSAVDNRKVEWNAENSTIDLVEGTTEPEAPARGDNSCLCGSTTEEHSLGCTEVGGGQTYEWIPITSLDQACTETAGDLTPGRYYLTKSIETNKTYDFFPGDTWIDLNGYNITYTGTTRLFRNLDAGSAESVLTIADIRGGGVISSSITYTQGGIVWVKKAGRLNFLGGTMDLSDYTCTYGQGGAAVAVEDADSSFYMYGGTIIGGTSIGVSTGNDAGKGRGGAVYVASGTYMYLKGGTIRDGKASYAGGNINLNGTMVMSGGSVENGICNSDWTEVEAIQNSFGGNIYVGGTGWLTISGGKVLGGRCQGNGGSIRYDQGNPEKPLTISGEALISGGETTGDRGGNIWITGSGKLVMNGGTVENGTSKKEGGNIWGNAKATLELNAGTITGGMAQAKTNSQFGNVGLETGTSSLTIGNVTIDGYVSVKGSGNTVTITGNPQFINRKDKDGKEIVNEINLSIASNQLTLVDVASTASVGITAADVGVFAPGAAESMLDVFFSDSASYEVIYTASGLELAAPQPHVHCVCGGSLTNGQVLADGSTHTCVDVTWTAADSAEDLKVAGNYYLTKDLVVSGQTSISGVNVNVCLNGHNITYTTDAATVTGSRVLSVEAGANVTLTSCKKASANNTIARVGAVNINGGVVHVDGSSTLNIYTVKLDGSGLTIKGSGGGKHGGTLRAKNSVVNMYSGTIVGATMVNAGSGCHGGSVALEGTDATTTTFNMLGGTIRDGIGHQWAGNVYIFQGTFNMYAGEIRGGKIGTNASHQQGNVSLRATGVLNISGGFIDGNISCGTGGGTVNISGSAQILRNNNLVSNGIFYENLTITIGDLNENAKIALAIRNLNKVATDKMETEDIKVALIGTGFVEAEDMAKIGLTVIEKPTEMTYGLKLVGSEIYAYKTN